MKTNAISADERLEAVKAWPPQVAEADSSTVARLIFDAATEKSCWIYDPLKKEWTSPAEFLKTQSTITRGNEAYLKRVEVRDPKEGISAGFKRIEELKLRLEDLVKRVTSYYQNK